MMEPSRIEDIRSYAEALKHEAAVYIDPEELLGLIESIDELESKVQTLEYDIDELMNGYHGDDA